MILLAKQTQAKGSMGQCSRTV